MRTSVSNIINIRFGLILIGFAIAWISFSAPGLDLQSSLPIDSVASQAIKWFHSFVTGFQKISLPNKLF